MGGLYVAAVPHEQEEDHGRGMSRRQVSGVDGSSIDSGGVSALSAWPLRCDKQSAASIEPGKSCSYDATVTPGP